MSSVRTKQVSLPSGAVVVFRPLHTEELNLIAKSGQNANKRAKTERYDGLVRALQNCTVEVKCHGPFETFKWEVASDADQMVGIFALRSLTFGASFDTTVQCDYCAHRWQATPLLTPTEEGGDLRVFPTSADGRAALSNGGLLPSLTLPSGTKVVCRVLAGAARKEANKLLEELSDDPIVAGVRMRIVKMTLPDGTEVEPSDITPRVRELEASDIPALQEYIADAEGGVDDTFPMECPKCGEEVDVSHAPFLGARAFWGFRGGRQKRR